MENGTVEIKIRYEDGDTHFIKYEGPAPIIWCCQKALSVLPVVVAAKATISMIRIAVFLNVGTLLNR